MPHLLRERDRLLTAMSLGDMAEPEKVAAGLRAQSLANEIAASYARIQGQDRPPSAAEASWVSPRRALLEKVSQALAQYEWMPPNGHRSIAI